MLACVIDMIQYYEEKLRQWKAKVCCSDMLVLIAAANELT